MLWCRNPSGLGPIELTLVWQRPPSVDLRGASAPEQREYNRAHEAADQDHRHKSADATAAGRPGDSFEQLAGGRAADVARQLEALSTASGGGCGVREGRGGSAVGAE